MARKWLALQLSSEHQRRTKKKNICGASSDRTSCFIVSGLITMAGFIQWFKWCDKFCVPFVWACLTDLTGTFQFWDHALFYNTFFFCWKINAYWSDRCVWIHFSSNIRISIEISKSNEHERSSISNAIYDHCHQTIRPNQTIGQMYRRSFDWVSRGICNITRHCMIDRSDPVRFLFKQEYWSPL